MPAGNRLWLDDHEDVGPASPEVAQGGPEQPVETVQGRSRPLSFEHRDRLPKGEHFKGGVAASAKARTAVSIGRMNSSTNPPL